MSEEQTRELVEQLKELNDSGDEDGDAEKILRKIRKLKQPSAIGMLLLFRSGQDGDKWLSGEWDEVFSTITGFPKKTYAVEFGKVASEFARASHYPFIDFISIIIGQDLGNESRQAEEGQAREARGQTLRDQCRGPSPRGFR
jgi:hypothetical protein